MMKKQCCRITEDPEVQRDDYREEKGFTLVELMVSMMIFSILLFMIYSAFSSQTRANTSQSEIVDMQQNIRVSIHYITYALRMSGFDPENTGNFGFFHADSAVMSSAVTGTGGFAVRFDLNEDGVVDKIENTAFRINGNVIEQLFYDQTADIYLWEPLTENVEALNFVYLDEDNAVIANPESSLERIRSVQMTIIEGTENDIPGTFDDKSYTNKQGSVILDRPMDDIRRAHLSITVKCRNMWL